MTTKSPWMIRIVAVVLAFLIPIQSVLVQAAQVNFWQDRHKSLTNIQLTAVLGPTPPLSSIAGSFVHPLHSFDSPKKSHWPASIQQVMDAIPPTAATVQNVVLGKDLRTPPIILLQDVHLNTEAQLNIASVLQSLIDKNQTGFIGVEGAFGPFLFDPIRMHADPTQVKQVAREYLEKNLISAPSFIGLTSAAKLPRMMGVDSPAPYEANVQAYLDSGALKERAVDDVLRLKSLERSARRRYFSTSLARFDDAREDYQANRLDFGSYVQELTSFGTVTDGVIDQFLEVFKIERSLDFTRVENERRIVLEKLTQKMNGEEIRELTSLSLSYQAGALTFGDFHRMLRTLCEAKGISLALYPTFDRYLRYVLLCDGLKADQIFASVQAMGDRITVRLTRTPEEKYIVDTSEQIRRIDKLLAFSLTPLEWQSYQAGERDLNKIAQRLSVLAGADAKKYSKESFFTALRTFENFYRQADIRSHRMVQKLMSSHAQGSRVLVAGGFHTNEILDILRAHGTACIVVSPKLSKMDDAKGNAYLSIFEREKTPLTQLFTGNKLFISPAGVVSVLSLPGDAGRYSASTPIGRQMAMAAARVKWLAEKFKVDPRSWGQPPQGGGIFLPLEHAFVLVMRFLSLDTWKYERIKNFYEKKFVFALENVLVKLMMVYAVKTSSSAWQIFAAAHVVYFLVYFVFKRQWDEKTQLAFGNSLAAVALAAFNIALRLDPLSPISIYAHFALNLAWPLLVSLFVWVATAYINRLDVKAGLPADQWEWQKEFAPVSLSLILGLLEVIVAVMLTQTGFWSVPLPALVIAATLSFWLIVPANSRLGFIPVVLLLFAFPDWLKAIHVGMLAAPVLLAVIFPVIFILVRLLGNRLFKNKSQSVARLEQKKNQTLLRRLSAINSLRENGMVTSVSMVLSSALLYLILGFFQLQRLEHFAALVARGGTISATSAEIPSAPKKPGDDAEICLRALSDFLDGKVSGGYNRKDQNGNPIEATTLIRGNIWAAYLSSSHDGDQLQTRVASYMASLDRAQGERLYNAICDTISSPQDLLIMKKISRDLGWLDTFQKRVATNIRKSIEEFPHGLISNPAAISEFIWEGDVVAADVRLNHFRQLIQSFVRSYGSAAEDKASYGRGMVTQTVDGQQEETSALLIDKYKLQPVLNSTILQIAKRSNDLLQKIREASKQGDLPTAITHLKELASISRLFVGDKSAGRLSPGIFKILYACSPNTPTEILEEFISFLKSMEDKPEQMLAKPSYATVGAKIRKILALKTLAKVTAAAEMPLPYDRYLTVKNAFAAWEKLLPGDFPSYEDYRQTAESLTQEFVSLGMLGDAQNVYDHLAKNKEPMLRQDIKDIQEIENLAQEAGAAKNMGHDTEWLHEIASNLGMSATDWTSLMLTPSNTNANNKVTRKNPRDEKIIASVLSRAHRSLEAIELAKATIKNIVKDALSNRIVDGMSKPPELLDVLEQMDLDQSKKLFRSDAQLYSLIMDSIKTGSGPIQKRRWQCPARCT